MIKVLDDLVIEIAEFDLGYDDFREGVYDNPFTPGSPAWQAYIDGWEAADDESDWTEKQLTLF